MSLVLKAELNCRVRFLTSVNANHAVQSRP